MKNKETLGSGETKRGKAVALRYDQGNDTAPVITAKGRGNVAERMIELAQEDKVPIQEDPSLVEILSKMDLNQTIPPELYSVVAEVLAFVYKANKEAGADREGE